MVLRNHPQPTYVFHPFTPTYAYVSGDGYSSAHRETEGSTECDGTGYCAAFHDASDIKKLYALLDAPAFNVGLQRRAGGLDLTFPVHLGSANPATTRFRACALDVVEGRPR